MHNFCFNKKALYDRVLIVFNKIHGCLNLQGCVLIVLAKILYNISYKICYICIKIIDTEFVCDFKNFNWLTLYESYIYYFYYELYAIKFVHIHIKVHTKFVYDPLLLTSS